MIKYHRGQTTMYLVKVGDLEIVLASMSTPKHRSLHTPSPPIKIYKYLTREHTSMSRINVRMWGS